MDINPTVKKGTKGNPFFLLKYGFENGLFRLDPYPIIDDRGSLGSRLLITDIWPGFELMSGYNTIDAPAGFVYVRGREQVPSFPWDTFRPDLIALAESIEHPDRHWWWPLPLNLNACLIHARISDPALWPIEKKKSTKNDPRCWAFPVHFFMIEVKLPQELENHAQEIKELVELGLL